MKTLNMMPKTSTRKVVESSNLIKFVSFPEFPQLFHQTREKNLPSGRNVFYKVGCFGSQSKTKDFSKEPEMRKAKRMRSLCREQI